MTGRLRGWPAVTLVAAAFVVAMLGTTLPTPLYPLYAAHYSFGEFVSTVIFAVYAVGVTIGLLVFGHWSDQVGRRPMLGLGLLLSAASAATFLMAGPLALLFVGRLLSGLSAGIFTGTATATIVDLAPAGGASRASLVAAAANMGGLGSGPLVAGVLAQYASSPLRLCFVVDLVLLALALGGLAFVGEPVRRVREPRLRPRRLTVPAEARGVFVRAAIAGFAGFAVLGLFTAVGPAFLGTVLHHTNHALVGVVVVALFLASVVGQSMSTRIGLDRSLPWGCAALVIGMAVIAAGLPAHSLALLVAGAVIAGAGQGLSFRAGLGSVAAASPDEQRGAITSTFFTVLYVGISIPVIGEGALAAGTGLVTAGVAFALGVAVLAAVALLLLLRAARTPTDH